MNEKKVPQLFVAASEFAFNDPSHFPWTIRDAFRLRRFLERTPVCFSRATQAVRCEPRMAGRPLARYAAGSVSAG
jgi:hypothetical protein